MTPVSEHILLLSGSGRNVGKTSFIRKVIEQNAAQKLAAIKITPHFHPPTNGLIPIEVNDNFRVFQETDRITTKDSSLFLQSGAEIVLYIQTTDEFLNDAFSIAVNQLHLWQPIITESAALRKFIIPGLYIFIQKLNEVMKPSAFEMQKLADTTIHSDGLTFSVNPENISYNQNWKIK